MYWLMIGVLFFNLANLFTPKFASYAPPAKADAVTDDGKAVTNDGGTPIPPRRTNIYDGGTPIPPR